jgi:transcriptional regulator with XRE-family HTH domain
LPNTRKTAELMRRAARGMGRGARSGSKELWRRWGARLAQYRLLAGWTQQRLAAGLGLSAATVSSFETGHRPPRREYARKADAVLATGGALDRLWVTCNAEGQIPDFWRDVTDMERRASDIRQFQPLAIPELLQTPDYIEAIMCNTRHGRGEGVESLVAARPGRGGALSGVRLTFVLREWALEVVGSARVQAAQLDHLAEVVERREVRLVVIPHHAPGCPLASGPFRLVTLADGRCVVQAEHEGGVSVISGRGEVDAIAALFGDLQAEALSPGASLELIRRRRREL